MEPIVFLILFVIFWCVYYYVESKHDAAIIQWKNITNDKNSAKEQRELSNKYRNDWHFYDMLEKTLIHVIVSAISLITGTFWFFVSLLILSIAIRLILHNLLINKFLGISINHIDTTDWFDLFLRQLEKSGISQWTLKISIFIISIALCLLFILI